MTSRQPVSSHNRSNASAGPIRRAELVVAAPAAKASTTMALAAKRAPERSRRSNCPLSRKSSTRPSVAMTCWRSRRFGRLSGRIRHALPSFSQQRFDAPLRSAEEHHRRGQTYPFTSGALTTYGKMEFTGGYLQISMKQPSGDGAWPALWMLPGSGAGSSGDNFEIDMQEGGMTAGSANPNDVFSYHLHDGSDATYNSTVNAGVDLSAGFNTYGIDWVPGQSITWYLNGQQVGQVTSAQTTIPDEPMELIMSNEVANSSASGWHTTMDGSTPNSMPMQVADVQLYQNP